MLTLNAANFNSFFSVLFFIRELVAYEFFFSYYIKISARVPYLSYFNDNILIYPLIVKYLSQGHHIKM